MAWCLQCFRSVRLKCWEGRKVHACLWPLFLLLTATDRGIAPALSKLVSVSLSYLQSCIERVGYQPQICIVHSSTDWEFWYTKKEDLDKLEQFATTQNLSFFFFYIQTWKKQEAKSIALFYRGTEPTHDGSCLVKLYAKELTYLFHDVEY